MEQIQSGSLAQQHQLIGHNLLKVNASGSGVVNQKNLGYPNGCTHFSLLFLELIANFRGEIDGNTLNDLFSNPQYLNLQGVLPQKWARDSSGSLVPPENDLNGDPESIMSQRNLYIKSNDDSYTLMPAFGGNKSNLNQELDKIHEKRSTENIVGVLLMDGTQTFALAFKEEGGFVFFDPHGDSTQTAPAYFVSFQSQERESLQAFLNTFWDKNGWGNRDQIDIIAVKGRSQLSPTIEYPTNQEPQEDTKHHLSGITNRKSLKVALPIILGLVGLGVVAKKRYGTLSPMGVWNKIYPAPKQQRKHLDI